MLGEIAQQRAGIDLAEQRRRFAHRHRAGAERLDDEAEAREFLRARGKALDVGLVEFDDLRDEQDLPRDAGFVERRLHAFIDEALVRRVLIDDDEAVARLRHDIGLVHLRARRAERPVEQPRARVRRVRRARIGRGAPTSKAACAASAKPARRATRRRRRRRRTRASPNRGAAAPPRRNAAMVASPPVVAARASLARQRFRSALNDQRAHQAGIAEAHFGLGRMHVDVDLARIDA